ncbi:DUF2690 domain-containing protein [Streptomyces sp. NBC_00079]|uniref:DUF2690 domain-containing protein n=1 Tax=Streptomyces sp. NBC_00079 TaxID=2975644 RepID=UPI00324F6127
MRIRHITATAAMLTVVAGGLVATGTPAYAVGCAADSCYGKNPQDMGCAADAVTGDSITLPDGALVELRWSSACQASWGRASNVRGRFILYVSGGARQTQQLVFSGQRDGFSNMVRNKSYVDTAAACADISSRTLCTRPY